jgi:hypothetical protein
MAFVARGQLLKMQKVQKETGFYPDGYFNILGSVYGFPFNFLLLWLMGHYGLFSSQTMAFIIWIPFVIPGQLIRLYLEKKHADKIIPITEAKKNRNKSTFIFGYGILIISILLLYKFRYLIYP